LESKFAYDEDVIEDGEVGGVIGCYSEYSARICTTWHTLDLPITSCEENMPSVFLGSKQICHLNNNYIVLCIKGMWVQTINQ
jgi:hypothetical protein